MTSITRIEPIQRYHSTHHIRCGTAATLFDVFRGEQIGAGKKSLAFSLTFQSEEKTLTDKVVAKQQQKIVKRLAHEIGAQLRG